MKNRFSLYFLLLLGCFSLFSSNALAADGCEDGYVREEGYLVAQVFGDVEGYLFRMQNLGRLVCTGVYSTSQLSALNNEYQALLSEIDVIGENPSSLASIRTQMFIATILDTNYLGVAGTKVQADTIAASQIVACQAATKAKAASALLVRCF
ncbi:MAG: hypothetical protein KDD53_09070 [Bdellovibrionales bacterium]|nr:hypothetical protein [Bdellovibrionales bacterium]